MIPLQRPILIGDTNNQMRQMKAWAETLATQLEMFLSAIPEESLSEAVIIKLNAQSEQSRNEIQQIQNTLQSVMSQQKEMTDAITELQGG